jgi:hypothetical protein
VHLRTIDAETSVLVLDWETAGWGPPAVDLAPARGPYSGPHVDIETYVSIAHPSCANFDSQTMRRLVAAGTIFRRLAAIDWASSDLAFDDVSLPIARLRVYRSELLEAIQAAMPGQQLAETRTLLPRPAHRTRQTHRTEPPHDPPAVRPTDPPE